MKRTTRKIDQHTSSLLASIAEAKDDPHVIAELADVDPKEFREFLAQTPETMDEEAYRLLKAAEASADEPAPDTGALAPYRTERRTMLAGLTDPGVFADRIVPVSLLFTLYLGMLLSLSYGFSGVALILYLGGKLEAQLFWAAYASSFKTVFSLGLILGTALIVYRTQTTIPKAIEAVLKGYLPSDYYLYKRRFFSLRMSFTFSSEMVVIAFVIFSYCHFPLSARGNALMLVAACAEYALGTYVVRKLLYAAMMLYSLLGARITRNLFRTRDLDAVNTYVRLISTLAVICVCVHVVGYYHGPFLYDRALGATGKIFLLLPAIVATPLLVILHFYPRVVLQRLYAQSIASERTWLITNLQNQDLSDFEKRYYLIEFDKISSNELRSHSQLTLTDLFVGVTILIMLIGIVRW